MFCLEAASILRFCVGLLVGLSVCHDVCFRIHLCICLSGFFFIFAPGSRRSRDPRRAAVPRRTDTDTIGFTNGLTNGLTNGWKLSLAYQSSLGTFYLFGTDWLTDWLIDKLTDRHRIPRLEYLSRRGYRFPFISMSRLLRRSFCRSICLSVDCWFVYVGSNVIFSIGNDTRTGTGSRIQV